MSPSRSTVDSDSDSTSTELCDEPDRLSDVDSEELTSASDSYVMATDDEKHAYEGSSTSTSTPARSYIKSEPTMMIEGQRTDTIFRIERDDKSPSLSEISIAKITDQIRRLSAEDDNNTTVSQIPSVRDNDELSTGDYSVERSQTKETESKLQDYTLSEDTPRSSKIVNSYDYLSLKSHPEKTNNILIDRTDILIHRTDQLRDTEERKEIIQANSNNSIGLKTDIMDTTTNILRDSSREQTSIFLDKNYDKFITHLDTNDKSFESSLRFSSKVYLDSKNDNDSNDTDFVNSRALTVATESRPYYSKRYVVGHLPISPVTMDDKLTKLSHEIHNVTINAENLSPEETLKKTLLAISSP